MNKKITLKELYDAMLKFNQEVAPGSECAAFQDFVQDSIEFFGFPPWDDDHADMIIENMDEFGGYWLAVTTGFNDHYDFNTGDKVGEDCD